MSFSSAGSRRRSPPVLIMEAPAWRCSTCPSRRCVSTGHRSKSPVTSSPSGTRPSPAHGRPPPRSSLIEHVDNGLTLIDTWDVSFAGHDGTPVRAWYNRPAGAAADLPVVVEYIGYGGGRGEPLERLAWAAAGYRAPADGHPGPGLRLGRGRPHRRSRRLRPGGAGRADPGHRVPAHRLPHPPAHRCCPRRRFRSGAAGGGRPGGGHRQQPGRRSGARDGGPGARRRRAAHQRPVPDPYAPRGRYHRRRSRIRRSCATWRSTGSSRRRPSARWPTSMPCTWVAARPHPRCSRSRCATSSARRRPCSPPTTSTAARPGTDPEREIVVYPYNNHEGGGPAQQRRQLDWLRRAPVSITLR